MLAGTTWLIARTAIVDVAGLTLLQRAVPDDVLTRVMGVAQSVFVGTLGLGEVQLQQFGAPNDVLIRIAEQPGGVGAHGRLDGQGVLAEVVRLGEFCEERPRGGAMRNP